MPLLPADEKYAAPKSAHGVDGLRNDAVGVHRLVEIDDVVDDHVGAEGLAQAQDVVGEVNLAVIGRGKAQPRAGRNVVHELQHGAALVRARAQASGQILQAP